MASWVEGRRPTGGGSLLHSAVSGGNEVVVRLLVADYKVDIEAKVNDHGLTALHVAVIDGNEAVVQQQLEQGAAAAGAQCGHQCKGY